MALGFVAAAGTWLAAADLGGIVVRQLRPEWRGALAQAAGAAAGYAIIGFLVGAMAATHALKTVPVALLPFVLILVRLPGHTRAAGRLIGAKLLLLNGWREADWAARSSLLVTAFAAVTCAIAASLPAVWWDPLAYHLPIAALALRSGTLPFDPALTQTGFPLLGEAAALPAYALAGSSGAAMVTLGCGFVAALICGAMAQRIAPRAGPLATALVATSPLFIWLAPSFYVDVPFGMFVMAAIAVGFDADAGAQGWGPAALGGLLAGAATGVKIPGLAFAVVVAPFVLRRGRQSLAKQALVYAACFALAGGGWLVRSLVLTGDPLYPFLSARLSGLQAVRSFAERYVSMTRHWCGGAAGPLDALALPWRLLTDPRQFCGDPGPALRLGLLFFAVAAVGVKRSRALATAALAATAVWFFGSQQLRFFVPALCLLAVVAAAGAHLSDRLRRVAEPALAALCLFAVAADWIGGLSVAASNSIAPAFKYMAGMETGERYLSARLETYAAAEWLARRPGGTRDVLALDDVRGYYFGGRAVWGNPYYEPMWSVDWNAPAATRWAPYVRAGFRYLVVNANPAYVGRTPTGVDWQVLAADETAGVIVRVFAQNDTDVFELKRAAK